MAENLSKYSTKRSALFILFTGEEKGLLGSEFYVENPVLPLEQMVYCFKSDNAGYNDTSLVTIFGLP
jgi:Zn-dependent M28 family amino/carboxypeptidase